MKAVNDVEAFALLYSLPELPPLRVHTLREARRRQKHYAASRRRWRRLVPVLPINTPRELTVEELKRRRGGD